MLQNNSKTWYRPTRLVTNVAVSITLEIGDGSITHEAKCTACRGDEQKIAKMLFEVANQSLQPVEEPASKRWHDPNVEWPADGRRVIVKQVGGRLSLASCATKSGIRFWMSAGGWLVNGVVAWAEIPPED